MRVFTFDTNDSGGAEQPARTTPAAPMAPLPLPAGAGFGTLTQRQSEVHRAMLRFQEEHGHPATQSELSRLLGMKSEQGVKAHLVILEAAGYVVATRKFGHRSKMAVWPDP